MNLSPLRVGVIGLGFIGRAHVDALRRIPGVQVLAVAGSSQRIVDQANQLAIPRAYADYHDLLADADIDVVHNCTPNSLHYEINRATLEAGKACFAEKPLTVTTSEAADLVTLARSTHAHVAVNFNHRGFPQVQHARALIAAGQLGQVYAVHGSYLQDWLLYATDWNWRVDPRLGGPSRAVADIGSHWMDLAQSVSGSNIVEVMADLHTALPDRASEDFASVLLHFANGAHGVFSVSEISAGRKNRLTLEVDAERGALEWNSEDGERLWVGSRDRAAEFGQRDPRLAVVGGVSSLPAGHAEG
ncbi:MAG: Gfo/Idh/MocA family oxidoreductase, partial [Chloroflexi bacterium]|nr:Gfo/Idh/MocA family oxidoreductase [Chloroflexota bacterium]